RGPRLTRKNEAPQALRTCPEPGSDRGAGEGERRSALDADDLAQRVDDFHEIPLRRHDRVDRLVGPRGLVDDVRVLPALDARGCRRVVGQREAPLRLIARHGPTGAVAAALVALGIPAPADDVRARAHASRDDAEIASAGAHGALAGEVHLPPAVALARHVVVVAVDRSRLHLERPELW